MIVQNNSGLILNTEKIWCIEWCYRHPKNINMTPHFSYYKSYKTFDAVVDAYCDLRKNRDKSYGYCFYRISKTNFTGYKEFKPKCKN